MKKLIELQCRGESNGYKTNFLYEKDNIYLMDNHRMAAWCWVQCLDKECKYTIIHIDRHYDAYGTEIDHLTKKIGKEFNHLSLEKYNDLDCNFGYGPRKVMSWDNYIPIFDHYNSEYIIKYLFFTHGVGTIASFLKDRIIHKSIIDLIEKSPSIFCEPTSKLIINLDIDFFFINDELFLSDKVTMNIVDSLMTLIKDPKNILTIALSPECCGDWSKSEEFIFKYFRKYGIRI